MNGIKASWLEQIGQPGKYRYSQSLKLIKKFSHPEFEGEWYLQANGPGTFQRVLLICPPELSQPVPAVAVPFYFPEAMLGFEPDTDEKLPRYAGIEMMLHLVRRGFIAASADAFHLTYLMSDRERGDWERWADASCALLRDHPGWTGIGKLTADTKLLVDVLANDARVNAERIGIAGHSLGGKMAFYAGCLDDRIKVILASDFGIGWDQTNWSDLWYWGEKVEKLKTLGMDHSGLLGCAAPKPFCLLAGQYDNEDSWKMMCNAPGYKENDQRLVIVNHATGHRPPPNALQTGYDFLSRWLQKTQ